MMTETHPIRELRIPRSFETTESNKTGSWRFLRPRYDEKTSPCSAACPAGEDIARIEMLTSQGAFKEAWEAILQENPFPGVCGRVCFHPCEGQCNRKEFDTSVAIHTIERFLADSALRNGLQADLPCLADKKERVAIIGAGPAGLAAAFFLRRLGYGADVYEAASEPGGILRWGIPSYRLPALALRSDIDRITALGVRIFTGQPVTKTLFAEMQNRYDALFMGCGYSEGTPLGIPGETVETVQDGLAFLQAVRAGERPVCTGVSAVIGGGNTAVDVARTIVRLGGRAVILYRRRRQDMPAFEGEIVMALEEGVELKELLAPVAVSPEKDGLTLTVQPMKIAGVDRDGRGRIEPDGSPAERLALARLFTATGARASDPWYLPPADAGQSETFDHCVLVQQDPTIPFVYGGDLTNATKTVVHAIASGKQAAMVLDTFFREGRPAVAPRLASCTVGGGPSLSMEIYLGGARRERSAHIVSYPEINTDYFQFEPRIRQPQLLPEERTGTFEEIDLKISANLAIKEAGRCFNCGICNQCDNCYLFCPDVSILRGREMENRHINYDYCKGCGLCVVECPRNAMTLEEEGP